MKITENGLVLREVKLREADKILTLLTPHHGIVSASARGSLRPNSKLFSASGQFCYSEWTLHEGKAMYSVDEAMPIEVFFGLRQSIEAVAVAGYMAEILQILSPTGQEAERLLRLTLNCLHMLSEGKRAAALVKAVYELRALSESGYMPDLLACAGCGLYEAPQFYFSPAQGTLLCPACAQKHSLSPNLNGAALAALRHIVLVEDARLFAFQMGQQSQPLLSAAAESYLLHNLDYPPKTLAFLKEVI